MNRTWIFQANPEQFDIDAALASLDVIWWRTPQYAGEIEPGDIGVLWRAGPDAGVIGLAVVSGLPQVHATDLKEVPFLRDQDGATDPTTKVLLTVKPVPFVSKDRVRMIPEIARHRIITAPMGTVFPLSDAEWLALAPHLPPLPKVELNLRERSTPPALAWEQRAKGVIPLPGGYGKYLATAREICAIVYELRPSSSELISRMCETYNLTETAARIRESFLRKMGLIQVESGICRVSAWSQRWLNSGNDDVVIALLHSRCRFIGEMIAELKSAKSTDELLSVANERYQLGWDTKTQLDNRRGWLQSAGLIELIQDGMLQATQAGLALAEGLELYVPTDSTASTPVSLRDEATPGEAVVEIEDEVRLPVDELAGEIEASSTDSEHPQRFERALRDAFAFLGFDAEWLGGAGKTDVLLNALVGKHDSYRVTVDAKTTGGGVLGDQQVNWDTLTEHRQKHRADYALLVGPSPSEGRLKERSIKNNVAVMSAKQLAGLCKQHSRSPLTLFDYRQLFSSPGPVNTSSIDELAENQTRLFTLVGTICDLLDNLCTNMGRLKARDLWVILETAETGQICDEAEIQRLLDILASPLIHAIDGDEESGYVPASTLATTRIRLGRLDLSLSAEDHLGGIGGDISL